MAVPWSRLLQGRVGAVYSEGQAGGLAERLAVGEGEAEETRCSMGTGVLETQGPTPSG